MTTALREFVTSAIRYWEPRRLIYNGCLASIVLVHFGLNYPGSLKAVSFEAALGLFILVVLANIAYCAAYVVDIFAQASGYRDQWVRYRWVLLAIGVLFAGIITHFFSMAAFSAGVH